MAQACSASRPSQQPASPASAQQQAGPRARTGPAASPHAAHAHTPPRLRLQPLPHGPRMSALLFIFSTPRPRPLTPIPLSDRAPTALAGAGQGVTPGACPCLLGAAPTQPHATVGCLARLSTDRSPSAMEA